VAVLVLNYLASLAVETLNVRHITGVLPGEFEGYYSADDYARSQRYLKENTVFSLVEDGFFFLVALAAIFLGIFNSLDTMVRTRGLGEVATGAAYLLALLFISQILKIPFSLYQTFVIEEKYGFNRTKPKTFVMDLLKSWLIGAVIAAAVFSCLIWFFKDAGRFAWLYAWISVGAFEIFLIFVAPVVIMPLFNKFTPLDQGALREEIEKYAASRGFKLQGIYKMDSSKRSSKSNAFFTGFGKYKRIVLFDTLIEKHSVEELVSVLAHEIGHYKKRHILKSFLLSFVTMGLMFFILSLFINNKQLFEAFRMENVSVYASLIFFGFLYTPINFVFSIFTNVLSRKHEFEADRFAVETYGKPEEMVLALKKLVIANLSNLTPHPLKVFLDYSHPPVLERIRAIRLYKSN
jgi:STE24 endopeptidase